MNAHMDVGEGTNNPQVLLAKLVRTGCPIPPIFIKNAAENFLIQEISCGAIAIC
jgi:hypothetical protein